MANDIRNFTEYIPVIDSIIKAYGAKNKKLWNIMELEDYRQEMYFVYDDCTKTYDKNKSKFITYLSRMCKYKLQKIYRKYYDIPYLESLDSAEGIPDSRDAYDNISENSETVEIIKEFIGESKHSEILKLYFFEQMKPKEIADEYNIETDTVRKNIHRFKNRMRKYFKEND